MPQIAQTVLAIFLVGTLGACVTVTEGADTIHSKLDKGARLPDADGRITVSSTSTSNNSIEIVVKNLIRPEKINPHAHNYVVWEVFNGDQSKPQSVGALILDKGLTGRLRTATPFHSFGLFITAEPKVAQAYPTGERLFWADVNH